MALFLGFLLGIIASSVSVLIYEYASRPRLRTVMDDGGKAGGTHPDGGEYEFYHLKVCNLPAKRPLPGRKPAWSSSAHIEVFDLFGQRVIPDNIPVRWTSQPEPLERAIKDGQPVNLLDPAKLIMGRKVDVHQHEDQQIAVAVKFEGEDEFHIFTNESYLFPRWQNPAWRLGRGAYRVRVTVYYERGRSDDDFELINFGSRRHNLRLRRWPDP